MPKNKKTDEELEQQEEATRRADEEAERKRKDEGSLKPGLIKPGAPNPAEDLADIMATYHVSPDNVATIIKYITDTGSDNVFFNISELVEKFLKFPRQIPPATRRQILDHWIAINKITPPENYEEIASAIPDAMGPLKQKEILKKKITEGTVWTVDLDDNNMPHIRMIKNQDEIGTTLSEAKDAAKEMGRSNEGEEQLVSYSEALKKYMPNFKSAYVQKNIQAAWAAACQMNSDTADGKPTDFWDTFVETMSKQQMMREMMGVTQPTGGQNSSVSEVVAAFRELKGLDSGGGAIPNYLASPEAFAAAVKSAVGGDNQEVKNLNAKLDKMIEDQHAAELRQRDVAQTNLQNQLNEANNKIKDLEEKVEDYKGVTGTTIYDIVREIPGTMKDISKDVKSTIFDFIRTPNLSPRDASQRATELEGMASKIEKAGKMKEFGDAWFNLS